MRQQEAEQEAARRNVEDERRDRFVFYALDHSAGLGDDAWEVEMRLRTPEEGPVPEAVAVAAGPPEPAEATDPTAEPVAEPPEPVEHLEAFESVGGLEPSAPLDPGEDTEVHPLGIWDAEAEVPASAPRRRVPRPRLLHMWAAFVILVGVAFVGATILLSVVLRDYTHFGVVPTAVGIGLGLIAVWVGVALARTH
jgi:hypothetical protein